MEWQGEISGVQPRIRLLRSFDQRSHSYLGYILKVQGQIGQESREFAVAIGKSAHTKHQFRQVIPGMDGSKGSYQVVGEFLRSELRRYQASLVIAMAT